MNKFEMGPAQPKSADKTGVEKEKSQEEMDLELYRNTIDATTKYLEKTLNKHIKNPETVKILVNSYMRPKTMLGREDVLATVEDWRKLFPGAEGHQLEVEVASSELEYLAEDLNLDISKEVKSEKE